MNSQISIIGCGWLGFPLAEQLIKKDYTIKGSTTSKDKFDLLKRASIQPYLVKLSENKVTGNYSEFLKSSHTVIINIPPGLRKEPSKNHVAEMKLLIDEIVAHNIKNVLYISSTSVFKDEEDFPIINKNTAPNSTSISGQQLIAIEDLLRENKNFNTTILRFGGLIGGKRHPGKYLAQKKNVLNPLAPVNLIHRVDCLGIISKILGEDIWNVTLNAVYPFHPQKKNYYEAYCQKNSLIAPKFNYASISKGKKIESSNLVQLLGYTFKQAL